MNIPGFHRHKDEAPHGREEEAEPARPPARHGRALGHLLGAPLAARLGLASWLLVGVAALLFGLVWLLGATAVITQPVLVAFVVATVASPLVRWLGRHRVPRAGGASCSWAWWRWALSCSSS